MRSVTKLLLARLLEEDGHRKKDLHKWYKCKTDKLSIDLKRTFVQCHLDSASQDFLDSSRRLFDRFCLQVVYRILMLVLSFFLSLADMNGLLNRGKTFVLSADHMRKLMQHDGNWEGQSPGKKVLDIGAGDGNATKQLEEIFGKDISATEASSLMQWRLERQGFKILDVIHWEQQSPFQVISFLNVLDRCDEPMSLLRRIHRGLDEDGILLMAVVLPFDPFVMKGPRQVKPAEQLNVEGYSFEDSLESLVHTVLQPAGYEVRAWTRLPYFSEGDLFDSYYVLSDAVLLLRPKQLEACHET
eukprot:m.17931 g.17931  ORF g.17931 m.17931 type:complete len:300 (+) comp27568_c0_seq4:206-1105(+)